MELCTGCEMHDYSTGESCPNCFPGLQAEERKAPCGGTFVGVRPGNPDCGCGWGDLCELPRSQGHVAFAGKFEYFELPSGDIVRALIEAPIRCDVPVRNGARFVGTAAWAKIFLTQEIEQVSR